MRRIEIPLMTIFALPDAGIANIQHFPIKNAILIHPLHDHVDHSENKYEKGKIEKV